MNTTTSNPGVSASTTKATSWTLDASHTTVGFSVRHLMISNVRGAFHKVSGSAKYDPSRPEASQLTAKIEVASIDTRELQRDTHLKSADFFDVANYPTIDFVSKRVRGTGDGLEIVGDLTIHGTTREIVLSVTDITPEQKDPWGNVRVGASARTKIKRSDFGMTWNAALETGGFVVGDEIKIELEAELIKDK